MRLRSMIGLTLSFALIAINFQAFAADRGISVQPKQIVSTNVSKPNNAKSHALVIGIDNYTHGWPKLKNAIKDAELVAAEMTQRGFDVTLSKNPNSKQLKEIFETFYITKGADPEARLFVWYAGHGHTLQGEGFLIPTDAPVPHFNENISDRNIIDFKLKALNMSRFNEYVRLATSEHTYTVFDSCFGGRIFGSTTERTSIARLEDKPKVPAPYFLTSGTADQKVADDGNFRRLFLQVLKGQTVADINKDGLLTANEVSNFMTSHYTEITHGKQTPRATLKTAFKDEFTFKIKPPQPSSLLAKVPSPIPVDIWTYDKGSFERIVFDWPTKVSYALERNADLTRITFKFPADFQLEPLTNKKMRNINDAHMHRDSTDTIITLNISADRYVHDFIDGDQIILDVVNPLISQVANVTPPVQVINYPAPIITSKTVRVIQHPVMYPRIWSTRQKNRNRWVTRSSPKWSSRSHRVIRRR